MSYIWPALKASDAAASECFQQILAGLMCCGAPDVHNERAFHYCTSGLCINQVLTYFWAVPKPFLNPRMKKTKRDSTLPVAYLLAIETLLKALFGYLPSYMILYRECEMIIPQQKLFG